MLQMCSLVQFSLSRLIHLGVGVLPTMVAKAKMARDGLSTSLQVFPETRPMFSQWLPGTQNLDKVITQKHLESFQTSLPLYSTQRFIWCDKL